MLIVNTLTFPGVSLTNCEQRSVHMFEDKKCMFTQFEIRRLRPLQTFEVYQDDCIKDETHTFHCLIAAINEPRAINL